MLHTIEGSLEDLYRYYLDAPGGAAGDEARESVLDAVEVRSSQAACLAELVVVALAARDLEEIRSRLMAVLEVDGIAGDDAVDAGIWERARVLLAAVDAEESRRKEIRRRSAAGETYLPVRTELLGASVELSERARSAPGGQEDAFIDALASRLADLYQDIPEGSEFVAAALRESSRAPYPAAEPEPMGRWLSALTALALINQPRGYAGRTLSVDPVTRAIGHRALRVMLGYNRHDARIDAGDEPLDLDPEDVAARLEEASRAHHYWSAEGFPADELGRYLSPGGANVLPRSEPASQVQPSLAVRRAAQDAGGIVLPMLYPVATGRRLLAAERLWNDGVPDLAPGDVGYVLHHPAGDVRIAWDALPHPDGMLVGAVLRPGDILCVGRGSRDAADEGLLADLEREAARAEEPYGQALRVRLIAQGYLAVAEYDELHADAIVPPRLVLLSAEDQVLRIIRESVPAF